MPEDTGFGLLRAALARAAIRFAVGGSWASATFGEPRFTHDVDIVADLNLVNLGQFLIELPEPFFVDADTAKDAVRRGRSFNAIYMPTAFKFDLFPASGFALGNSEIARAITVSDSALDSEPVPYVTPEDILLAKLHWFRLGGESSEVQWRDIKGVIMTRGRELDRDYLSDGAQKTGTTDLLERAMSEADV